MNWQVSGASALSETGAARSSSSSLSARIAADAAALVRRRCSSAASLVTLSYVPRVRRVDRVHVGPGHTRHRVPGGQRLRQLNLQRIHGSDVMDHHADLAPIARDAGLPLGVGEAAREGSQCEGSLFQAIGQCVCSLCSCIHLSPTGSG